MASETIELRGHIIDSLILPKVLDQILTRGAHFKIIDIKIGQKRADQSFARIEVSAQTGEELDELILRLRQHGAEVIEKAEAQLARAPADGVFPNDFYVTTNQRTFIRLNGKDIEVQPVMLDSAIAVDPAKQTAHAVKFFDVRQGDEIVVSHQGIRVVPSQRATSHTDAFQFINTSVSAEQPKFAVIREVARVLERVRADGGKIVVAAGPAIVLTGAGEYLEKLIARGLIDRLFAGSAFAVYDVERALFGTSLGKSPDRLLAGVEHENHLRAINVIRAAGGIAAAVEKNILSSGIMHACVRHHVDIVLTGSIRDEGAIPGVMTDIVEAQKLMRDKLADAALVLLMGTVLHSLAMSTMLGPTVKVVCVNINPSAVARVIEQQPFHSIGIVTDVEPFLRQLTDALTDSDGAVTKRRSEKK